MKMESTTNGGIGKAFGRMLSGENLFQNRFGLLGGEGLFNMIQNRKRNCENAVLFSILDLLKREAYNFVRL